MRTSYFDTAVFDAWNFDMSPALGYLNMLLMGVG